MVVEVEHLEASWLMFKFLANFVEIHGWRFIRIFKQGIKIEKNHLKFF